MKLLLCATLLVALHAAAGTIEGRVVAVADGDTVTVMDATNTLHKIRLAGIDAPEKKQAFGQRSKDSLSDLVFDELVTMETDKRDKYRRDLGKVLVDGKDANLEQVTRGMAWHCKHYELEQSGNDRRVYYFAEKGARAAKRGLWTDADPMPRWEYRHNSQKVGEK